MITKTIVPKIGGKKQPAQKPKYTPVCFLCDKPNSRNLTAIHKAGGTLYVCPAHLKHLAVCP